MNNKFLNKYYNLSIDTNVEICSDSFFSDNINEDIINLCELASKIINYSPPNVYIENPNFEIKKTAKMGYGVFATKKIEKGQFFGEYKGIIRSDYKHSPSNYAIMYMPLTIENINELLMLSKLIKNSPFFIKLFEKYLKLKQDSIKLIYENKDLIKKCPDHDLVIDAEHHGNHLRFINHSNKPNLKAIHVFQQNKWKIYFFATKNIKQGKQLFFNYGKGYWQNRKKPL